MTLTFYSGSGEGTENLRWFEDPEKVTKVLDDIRSKFAGKFLNYISDDGNKHKVIVEDVEWDTVYETFIFLCKVPGTRKHEIWSDFKNFEMRNGKRVRIEVEI